MHALLEFITHTKEGYLDTSPFQYFLNCEYEKKIDYSGIHFTCVITRMEAINSPSLELLTEVHTYTDEGNDETRYKTLFTETYFKLMNLMLTNL